MRMLLTTLSTFVEVSFRWARTRPVSLRYTHEAVYWSALQLPPWFRSRGRNSLGWFTLLYLECSVVERVVGGMGCVLRLALEIFFGGGPGQLSFDNGGIILPHRGSSSGNRGACLLKDDRVGSRALAVL